MERDRLNMSTAPMEHNSSTDNRRNFHLLFHALDTISNQRDRTTRNNDLDQQVVARAAHCD
jgi:hypothetical protein